LAPGAAYDAIQVDPRTGNRTNLGRVDGGSRGFTLSGAEQVLLCRRAGMAAARVPAPPEPKSPLAPPPAALEATYYPPPESAGGWRSLVAANKTPTVDQKRAIRETAGMDWDRLRSAWDYCESFGAPDSLLVIRHGWVAAEWHTSTEPRGIASCTKSLTALSVARLLDLSDAGRLPQRIGPDDEAWRWLPASWAEAEPARRRIRIRHLLTMTSGLTPYDGPYKQDYLERVFAQTVESPPGEVWAYASVPVDMLSLILERAAGRTLGDFFNAEICAPIGAAAVKWGRFGEHTGGSGGPEGGARFPPRDLARVGYLVLHDGAWQRDGKTFQVISADRLKQMTRWAPFLENARWRQPNFAFEPNANQFYGHLWWTNRTGQGLGPAAPRDAVYMSGWGKQACFVVPSLDMVVVRLGPNRALNDHPEFYPELWSRIMAAVASSSTAVPDDGGPGARPSAVGGAGETGPAVMDADRMRVGFSRHLRPWDGFGVNCVEAAQTRDYKAEPQEYGGLSTLSEDDRRPGHRDRRTLVRELRRHPERAVGRTRLRPRMDARRLQGGGRRLQPGRSAGRGPFARRTEGPDVPHRLARSAGGPPNEFVEGARGRGIRRVRGARVGCCRHGRRRRP
jgi:CubicO group peptidase (beta-lactamase class C family)